MPFTGKHVSTHIYTITEEFLPFPSSFGNRPLTCHSYKFYVLPIFGHDQLTHSTYTNATVRIAKHFIFTNEEVYT